MSKNAKPPNELAAAWIDRAALGLVMLACLLAVSHHNADPDLWGHVRYGLDALQSGLPQVNSFSYNAPQHPWINHENLAELAMAGGLTQLGASAMLALKCLMGLLMFAWMHQQARRSGASQMTAAVVVLLAAVNLMHFWVMRPQLYSYFLFACLIGFLGWIFAGWQGASALPRRVAGGWRRSVVEWNSDRGRWLWATPILFCLWANTHGAFAAGFCIFSAYLGGRGVEAYLMRRTDAHRIALRHVLVVGLCFAATLLNPYGWRLHAWMLSSLGSPRPEITEWLSPELSYIWLPFWCLVGVGTVGWAATRTRRDATQTIIMALVLGQAFAHRRHIAFLAILAGFWLATYLESAWVRVRGNAADSSLGEGLGAGQRRGLGVVLGGCAVVMLACLGGQLDRITVKRDQYPVAAFQYMSDLDLRGKLVTRFMWAQYAIYVFGADSPEDGLQVAFDGRFRTCYPQEVVDMYFDYAVGHDGAWPRWRGDESPPADPQRILIHNAPDLVLLDRKQQHTLRALQQQRHTWTLLYQDQLAQLWGRSAIYGNEAHRRFIPPEHRSISDERQSGVVSWPAMPKKGRAKSRRISSSRHLAAALNTPHQSRKDGRESNTQPRDERINPGSHPPSRKQTHFSGASILN